jgi:ribosome biogenesis protein BRX1
MGRKRQREAKVESDSSSDDEPAPVRRSELEEPEPKKSKWINKQRVLVFGCRGLSYRDRHLVRLFLRSDYTTAKAA